VLCKSFGPQLFGLVEVDLDHIHFSFKDGGSMLLRNVIIHLQDGYDAQARTTWLPLKARHRDSLRAASASGK
jgi:hypothetical protein